LKRRRGPSGTGALLGAGAAALGTSATLAAALAEARGGSRAALTATGIGGRSGTGAGGERPQLPRKSSKPKQRSSGRLKPQKC
jgi:hypothetical protein